MRSKPGGLVLIILLIVVYHFLPTGLPLAKGKAVHSGRVIAGYVNPIGKGLIPGRIDQGVDYNYSSGPLYALGTGTIVNVYSSGWPGGTYIELHLADGPDKGKYVYYAESITPAVSVGQQVQAGQRVGTATGCSACGIEVGWAASPSTCAQGCLTMAAVDGQRNAGLADGDAGAYPTRCGVDFSNLIVSLGGRGGYTGGKAVQGSSC